MALRVLIDATSIPHNRAGVGRYVEGLTASLSRLTLEELDADVAVVCQRHDMVGFAREAPSLRLIAAPSEVAVRAVRLAWEQLGLPGVARQFRADVVHSPHYTMPLSTAVFQQRPAVVTLHDATVFTDAALHLAFKLRFVRAATRIAAARAARCIVPSQSTRRELVRLIAADERRIVVIYHGVDHEKFHAPTAGEIARVGARLGLNGQPYIAFLGTLEPRKNIPNLIRGWVRAMSDYVEPLPLVLAGGPGWGPDLEEVVRAVPPRLTLLRAGYLPIDELRGYLGGATLVAYPSVGEGFGFPLLEAMACGAPVLTTRRLSLPEVAGDAAAYTEPEPEAIASALDKLLRDPQQRASLSKAGRTRSLEFTWERCARAHLATYRQAANA